MKHLRTTFASILALAVAGAGCESDLARPELPTEGAAEVRGAAGLPDAPYTFEGPVFDIAATPDGSILVIEGDIVKEISRKGIREVVGIPTLAGEAPIDPPFTPINGLEPIGRGNFFATRGGLDEAKGASLWRASPGGARLVADIEGFEREHDPDATKGPQWKDPQCEAAQGYTPGPQSNPFHLTALSGSEVLVADAAGNTLLWAKTNGEVDWVAVFTPPVDQNGDYLLLPDWRIEPGSRHVVCPSDACKEVISGLTAVIDLAFGPDGMLYVVEHDENGWLAPIIPDILLGGGTIQRCNADTGACEPIAEPMLPGAITFDKWGNLWVVENNIT